MKDLVAKFVELETEMAKEKGNFSLFALFLREDVPDRWDLVVSAPWFGDNQKVILDYLVNKIKSRLKDAELLLLSRIVLVSSTDPTLKAIHKAFEIEHGMVEVQNSNFFGLMIKHAYIITSKHPNHILR
jgi:hypothetical protein